MGYSYDEALKKAQAALESSEKEFDELDEERTAYADAMAQQQYEDVLAAGYSYEQGQLALDEAERQYSMSLMEGMQVPEIAPEADEYAAQVGQEQYDLAQWMGMPA